MSFSFVDRILEIKPGRWARGVRRVNSSDRFLEEDGSGAPVLLSSIVGEALGQLGAWCVFAATDCKTRAVAGVVGEIRIHDRVRAGETLYLETWIDSLDEDAVVYHSEATVDGRPVLSLIDALGPLLPMEDFSDPEQVRSGLQTLLHSEIPGPVEAGSAPPTPLVDPIDSWDRGKSVEGRFTISPEDVLFRDHFPRKPVVPLSLLLESQLRLGRRFVREDFSSDSTSGFSLSRVRKVKMSGFVAPGDPVKTRIGLKERALGSLSLSLRSEVRGKRILVGEATFTAGTIGRDGGD